MSCRSDLKIILFSILIAVACCAKAQENELRSHSLRLGLNLALFTPNGSIGIGNYAEYGHSIRNRIAIVPRIMSASADQRMGNEELHLSQLGVSISARVTPFPSVDALTMDLGGIYQRLSSTSTRSSTMPGTLPITDRSITKREHLAGILGSVGYRVLRGGRLGAGVRAETMTAFRTGIFTVEMVQFGIFMHVDL